MYNKAHAPTYCFWDYSFLQVLKHCCFVVTHKRQFSPTSSHDLNKQLMLFKKRIWYRAIYLRLNNIIMNRKHFVKFVDRIS